MTTGEFETFPDNLTDLVNAAGYRGWKLFEPKNAASICVQAADEITDLIIQLPRSALEKAVETGRIAMIDRSQHWEPHLIEIKHTQHR